MLATRKEIDAYQLETAQYLIKAAQSEIELSSQMKWIAPQLYEATVIDLVMAKKMQEAAEIDKQATLALENNNIELWSQLSLDAAKKRRNVALQKSNTALVLTSTNQLMEMKTKMEKLGRKLRRNSVRKSSRK